MKNQRGVAMKVYINNMNPMHFGLSPTYLNHSLSLMSLEILFQPFQNYWSFDNVANAIMQYVTGSSIALLYLLVVEVQDLHLYVHLLERPCACTYHANYNI